MYLRPLRLKRLSGPKWTDKWVSFWQVWLFRGTRAVREMSAELETEREAMAVAKGLRWKANAK